MTIDRAHLERELAGLDRQYEGTIANHQMLQQIEGARRAIRHLLGTIDRQEKEKAEAEGGAEPMRESLPVEGD